MNKYFVEEDTHRLTFDDGEWVDLKKEMSAGDQEKLQTALFQLDTQGVTDNREGRRAARRQDNIKVNFRPSYLPLLEINIQAWSFSNGNDEKVPLTRENIAKLKDPIASLIADEIDRLNPFSPEATPKLL
jgi:hypothetical protein